MNKYLVTISLVFLACKPFYYGFTAQDPLKVAIIDTGLDLTDKRFDNHLCLSGHKSFVDNDIVDYLGHGTHVAGIIRTEVGEGNYCLLIYKFYSPELSVEENTKNEIKSINEAIKNHADLINISAGGFIFQKEEYRLIKHNPNVLFIVAAMNEHKDMDIPGNEMYPAMYDLPNIVTVGSVDRDGTLSSFSNHTKRMVTEKGENVLSFLPNGQKGYLSGTSMATPKRTARIVKSMLRKRYIHD